MQVPISRLKLGESVRLEKAPCAPGKRPIDVLADGTVIDGERRVLGAKERGWEEIPARVWRSMEEYEQYKSAEFAATLRDLEPSKEIGDHKWKS